MLKYSLRLDTVTSLFLCRVLLLVACFFCTAILNIGEAATRSGDGCSVFSPCGNGYSCQPFVHKCYHSPRQNGEPCSAGYSCGRGLTCEAGSQRCKANGRAGDSCHATRPCGSGLSCQPGVHKCYHSPRREGEACSAGYGCGTGLNCEAGSQVCRKPSQVGDACHATRPCGSGLSCQPGVHKCYHSPRKAGEPCVAGYSCGTGLYCQSFLQKCVANTIDYNSSSACSSLRVPAIAEDAKSAKSTLTFSGGSAGGVGAFASFEMGLVYGNEGQFGCFATACIGQQADASVENFANFGIYSDYDNFEGFSVVTGAGADVPFIELGFQTSQVWSADPPPSANQFLKNRLIGTASGLSFGVGLNPVSINYAACYTEVLDDSSPLSGLKKVESTLKQWAKTGFAPDTKPSDSVSAHPPIKGPTPIPSDGRSSNSGSRLNTYVPANNNNETNNYSGNFVFNGVNGHNVRLARHAYGHFQEVSAGVWNEFNKAGGLMSRLTETGRDEWSVYLQSSSRQVFQIDIHRQLILKGRNQRNFYRITSAGRAADQASNQAGSRPNTYVSPNNNNETNNYSGNFVFNGVNGQNVRLARHAYGYFQEVSAGVWNEFNDAGGIMSRLTETGRDKWSVYLLSSSRQAFQIDIHRQMISGKNKRNLYRITSAGRAADHASNQTGSRPNTHVSPNNNNETNNYSGNFVFNGVNGHNVRLARHYYGHFQEVSAGVWNEYNKAGGLMSRLTETGRDEWSVYLENSSRQQFFQIDIHRQLILRGRAKRDFYRITSVGRAAD